MRIRRANLLDLPGIYRVERECFPDPWPLLAFLPYFLEGDTLAFVAEDRGIIAFVLALRKGEELHIHDLAVALAHRRKGVASALLHHLLSQASDAHRVRLEVRVSNQPARAFYAKHGFREAALLPHYYADGEDGILMIRDLSES